MNLRRLKYFVKIVDIGSLTQAADVLHIAQPALSQQLQSLEAHFRQKLLIRSQQGVTVLFTTHLMGEAAEADMSGLTIAPA